MKQAMGWYWPDHEHHLIDWMRTTPPLTLNGRQAYQGKKQVAALAACRNFRTAVDVGAHIGLWSYNLAFAFKHVHAFEPAPPHLECFLKNVMAPNVELHTCALGAVPGHVVMEFTAGSSGDTKIDPTFVDVKADYPLAVPMLRLDDLGLKNVDLIKIDCEGYEENVLVGAVDTILEWKPAIVVEQKREMSMRFNLKPQGAVRWLQHLGYKEVANLGGDHIMVPA